MKFIQFKYESKIKQIHQNILENSEYKHIITWAESGSGFRILDLDQFKYSVLDKEFGNQNYQTFVRQLHLYGFKKAKGGHDDIEYNHNLFRKNDKQQMGLVKRTQKIQFKQEQIVAEIDLCFSMTDLERTNQWLYQQIQQLKEEQKQLNEQINLSQKICFQMQKNITYLVNFILALEAQEDCEEMDILDYFIQIVCGLKGQNGLHVIAQLRELFPYEPFNYNYSPKSLRW